MLLLLQVPSGAVIYILLAKMFKIKEYDMTKDIVMGFIAKMKGKVS